MEKIIIHNFLNLTDIEFELSEINLLIGPQAQGKSIVAKLIFFFKNFFLNYRTSIVQEQRKNEFDKSICEEFKEIFPEYTWNHQDFEIIYCFSNYSICLETKLLSKGKRKLSLIYSDELSKIRRKLLKNYGQSDRKTNYEEKLQVFLATSVNRKYETLNKLLSQHLFESEQNKIEEPIFIPAGRSFFANLQNNIFSLLSKNISIDYFLKEFGFNYEIVKNSYNFLQSSIFENYPEIDQLISQILVGRYSYEQRQDWLYSLDNQRKINLSNASSGQQEALPMTTILAILPFIRSSDRLFIIEEPEAHLFPNSQKHIIELISLVFNLTGKKHRFLITTHSPYILT
ncbi:MAG: ATP-binding protein, partial [Oscillatoria sp. PMC 1068.18]|nr:ATP-binding protein [Oscillatoria sp. PMC 1068.18]